MKLFSKKTKKADENQADVLVPDFISWYNPATYGHPMIDEQWDGEVKQP